MRLALGLTAALGALIVTFAFASNANAGVGTPVPGLDFWIAVPGAPGCSTQHGDATCHIAPGATFVLDVYLNSAGVSYGGYDVNLQYQGVSPNHDADQYAWPDCAFPASSYDTPGIVGFGCAVGINAPGSTYNGLIGSNSFVCSQSGGVSLVHGVGQTDLLDSADLSIIYSEDPRTSETLAIRCDLGETPSPTVTGTPRTATPTAAPPRTPLPTFLPPEPAIAFDVNFWIAVEGVPNCTSEYGDATCELVPGAAFVVDVFHGLLAPNPQRYIAYDFLLGHTGVESVPVTGGPAGGCSFDEPSNPGVVGCSGQPRGGVSVAPGVLGSVRFECAHSGTVTMLHGRNHTDVVDTSVGVHTERPSGGETLHINCGPALPSTGSGASTGNDPFPAWPTAAACVGAAFVALGAWGARRRRARSR